MRVQRDVNREAGNKQLVQAQMGVCTHSQDLLSPSERFISSVRCMSLRRESLNGKSFWRRRGRRGGFGRADGGNAAF